MLTAVPVRGLEYAVGISSQGLRLAGAACMTGAKAWAQIAPLHCVPPLPSIQAVLFNPPTGGTVLMRKSVFDLSVTEVTRLKAAYAALRNVYREDPRSWYNQGLCALLVLQRSARQSERNGDPRRVVVSRPGTGPTCTSTRESSAHLIGDPTFALTVLGLGFLHRRSQRPERPQPLPGRGLRLPGREFQPAARSDPRPWGRTIGSLRSMSAPRS